MFLMEFQRTNLSSKNCNSKGGKGKMFQFNLFNVRINARERDLNGDAMELEVLRLWNYDKSMYYLKDINFRRFREFSANPSKYVHAKSRKTSNLEKHQILFC